eukprot:5308785-Prorocentrum_lima.AAC.1
MPPDPSGMHSGSRWWAVTAVGPRSCSMSSPARLPSWRWVASTRGSRWPWIAGRGGCRCCACPASVMHRSRP